MLEHHQRELISEIIRKLQSCRVANQKSAVEMAADG